MKTAGLTLFVAALALAVAGCNEERPRELRNLGLSDRCADFMRLSFPRGEIEIKETNNQAETVENGNLGLTIIEVEGVRPKIPQTGGFLARDVAARCRFQNGVLVEFRWTKGPLRQ